MADSLIAFWALIFELFRNPIVSAPAGAVLTSIAIGNYKTAISCGIIAACSVNLVLYITGLPTGLASGVGAGMALLGVHTMEERVKQIDPVNLIKVAIDRLKGRP